VLRKSSGTTGEGSEFGSRRECIAAIMMRPLITIALLCTLALCGAIVRAPDQGATGAGAMTQASDGTPRPAGTPQSLPLQTPSPAAERSGIAGRIVAQQEAAQATIAAYAERDTMQATRIAELESALSQARVTATALVVVAANTVLDPERESLTIQTDLAGMLNNNENALADARTQLSTQLSRYPIGCRAGFMLISGNAPDISQGIALAERVEALLREFWPDIFMESTGAERFAQPGIQPFGEVQIDIFFYSGCVPIE
jgi:hypothetical protein